MECTIGNVESVRHIDEGKTKGAAYDTAWVARVTDECGKPLFPECVKWLLNNQKSDGSWGCQIQNYHDRVLSTLSAIIALKELDGKQFGKYIQRGEEYIWENIKKLERDNYRLIGSELLFPSLMEEAESMKLHLPYHVNIYQKEYYAKLKKIDEAVWYSPMTTLSFSLEFLGEDVDIQQLPKIQLSNGSVGNSPASTAYFLKHITDLKAMIYLRDALTLTKNGSVMTVHPIDMFEYGWTVYNLMLAGVYLERFSEICDFLFNNIGPHGAGWSTFFPIPDADDTAVILKVLHNLQYKVDSTVLKEFYTGDYFLTFVSELDPSISTNIHVLDFVKNFSRFSNQENVIEQLVYFLKREIDPDGFWIDKWHTSPYYPTSHAVFALCDIDPSLAEKAISWILETQHENGLWGRNDGMYKGTLEETAYALQALLYYHKHVEPIDTRVILMALSALNMKNFVSSLETLPEMWVAKVLLAPIRVIRSAVASVQFMARVQDFQSAFVACGRWIL